MVDVVDAAAMGVVMVVHVVHVVVVVVVLVVVVVVVAAAAAVDAMVVVDVVDVMVAVLVGVAVILPSSRRRLRQGHAVREARREIRRGAPERWRPTSRRGEVGIRAGSPDRQHDQGGEDSPG